MADIITAQHLTKEYRTHKRGSTLGETIRSLYRREHVTVKAVDDISFSIPAGQIMGMLGPNGAGKSTTIKMLTGILTPTAGQIEVMGYNPQKQRTRYVSQIGAMFGQKSQLIWDIPAMDAFVMNKAIYNIPTEAFDKRLSMLVELLDAKDIINKPVRVLSLGERMKCEFIIALLHNPRVVFLDEPTIGLDVIAKEHIRTFIKQMNEQGVTFILTTHDLGDIESLAHAIMIIDKGTIVFNGKVEELKRYLGNKKAAMVTTKTAVDFNSILRDGLMITSVENNQTTFSIDVDMMPMGEFLTLCSTRAEILDMSVFEPEMETIVKAIYRQ